MSALQDPRLSAASGLALSGCHVTTGAAQSRACCGRAPTDHPVAEPVSAAPGWWGEVVAGDDVVQPGCVAKDQSVLDGESGKGLRIGRPCRAQLCHPPEEVLEAG